jgi:cystathionine beta-lyase/cystathionine gamma-synthase
MKPSHTGGFSTRAVHAGADEASVADPVVTPIYQTTTFHSDPSGAGEVLYARYGNTPNHLVLQRRLAALEGAEGCTLFGSGMGAMAAAVLSCVGAGDHVLAPAAGYSGTRDLLRGELARLGIRCDLVDFHDPAWRAAVRADTRLLVLEVPTNPLLRVIDLAGVVAVAAEAGAAVVVDATFATPINFRPLEHGVDLVMHSATKYLGGHSDVTAGVVCGSAERMERVGARARLLGAALDPHAAWLLERGLKTLALRMQRHNENGLAVARWCAGRSEFARGHHPGLPSHPDHELASRLLDGYGGMLGVELHGGADAATRFIGALRLAKLAPSLGGVETLVSEPRFTSQASISAEERARLGIPDGFVRFSLGIEDAEDIIADLEQALAAAV